MGVRRHGITLLYPKVPHDFDLTDPKQKQAVAVYDQALFKIMGKTIPVIWKPDA